MNNTIKKATYTFFKNIHMKNSVIISLHSLINMFKTRLILVKNMLKLYRNMLKTVMYIFPIELETCSNLFEHVINFLGT